MKGWFMAHAMLVAFCFSPTIYCQHTAEKKFINLPKWRINGIFHPHSAQLNYQEIKPCVEKSRKTVHNSSFKCSSKFHPFRCLFKAVWWWLKTLFYCVSLKGVMWIDLQPVVPRPISTVVYQKLKIIKANEVPLKNIKFIVLQLSFDRASTECKKYIKILC